MSQVQWFPFTSGSTFIDPIMSSELQNNCDTLNTFKVCLTPVNIFFLYFFWDWLYWKQTFDDERYFQHKLGSHSDDYINASALIFTPFPRRKYIFSLIAARKPQRCHSIPDCCKRLIRLIRFFSDGARC